MEYMGHSMSNFQKKTFLNSTLLELMKFGMHVGFDPQTSNLKFFIDWMIDFRDRELFFFKLRKNEGVPNFK